MINLDAFADVQLDHLLTPCLAVSPRVVRDNYQAMIAIAGSADRLRPHVKTHKCPEIVKIASKLGISKHKCATLAEAEMLAELTRDILIAYPLVGPNVAKLADLAASFPQVRFSTVIDCARAANLLGQVFSERNQAIDVLIDVNVGMNRTGIPPNENATVLAKQIKQLSSLNLVGLHVYDGQNHQPNLSERTEAVTSLMNPVVELVQELNSINIPIGKLVCGGTPTFPVFAKWASLNSDKPNVPQVELSPGTSVLSDYNYGRDYPDIVGVQPAAMLFTRVVSKPGPGLITVDLGHKAVAADPPAGRRCHFVDLPDAEEIKHSEEHLVVRTAQADNLEVGQVLRVLPGHICPTVALHANMVVVEDGKVSGFWPIMRHRIYA
jgi:D-threonine aldolase